MGTDDWRRSWAELTLLVAGGGYTEIFSARPSVPPINGHIYHHTFNIFQSSYFYFVVVDILSKMRLN